MHQVRSQIEFFQATYTSSNHPPTQPRTLASSRYPSYTTRLIGDVTSVIAEDDWERGCPPPHTPHPFAQL